MRYTLKLFTIVIALISLQHWQARAEESDRDLVMKGADLARKGRYDEAVNEIDKALKLNSGNPAAYYIRGVACFYQGNTKKALGDFDKAIDLNRKYADAYNGRGLALASAGLADRALEDFNTTLELDPKNASAYMNRAVTYFKKKQYEKSMADVKKAESLGAKVNSRFLSDLNISVAIDNLRTWAFGFKGGIQLNRKGGVMGILIGIAIVVIAFSLRIIQQYETGVVFQLGRYSRTLHPGLNFIIPVIEHARVVDMRISTHDIPEQQVITKDNVPVAINGVVYFKVENAQTAVIKVQNYTYAVSQYAQAALRDVVGGMTLDDLLTERQKIGEKIEESIQKEAASWGLLVTAIKLQDVNMPEDLKKIMSRQASAEREKRATITKAEGDKMAALNLAEAAKTMAASPGAMQLRTLQTIDGLGPSPSNTVVLAVPVDILELARGLNIQFSENAQKQVNVAVEKRS
ncbi:MAG: tetratricopeptide repeat protein [Candidatus Omnitrophica bacterium]|nr:tetratricopeptide repeat protein [Candidatus Omnitrophota bacterium]